MTRAKASQTAKQEFAIVHESTKSFLPQHIFCRLPHPDLDNEFPAVRPSFVTNSREILVASLDRYRADWPHESYKPVIITEY